MKSGRQGGCTYTLRPAGGGLTSGGGGAALLEAVFQQDGVRWARSRLIIERAARVNLVLAREGAALGRCLLSGVEPVLRDQGILRLPAPSQTLTSTQMA